MLPSLSVASSTTPSKHFAAGTVASFDKGGIGYREWARRNGRLADIHSIDDRYDHDIDELMAWPHILIERTGQIVHPLSR